jgi:hypothetical protein
MPDDPRTATISEPAKISISNKTTDESKPFIGQWNTLVSTTNWDKGSIICQWRKQLENEGVGASECSDEAWSQLVGGVTPQHVGRLRRCYDRFGHVFESYEGVFWSHFYAALDWDDAEMWLEGAVQNKWSVSGMRKQRWETLGKVGSEPNSADIVATELNEETQSLSLSEKPRNNDRDYVEGPVHEGPDFGDEGASGATATADRIVGDLESPDGGDAAPPKPHAIRPFESFDKLPEDVMDAASAFKVAIIKHKAAEWEECPQEELLGMLDALKQLATIAAE